MTRKKIHFRWYWRPRRWRWRDVVSSSVHYYNLGPLEIEVWKPATPGGEG